MINWWIKHRIRAMVKRKCRFWLIISLVILCRVSVSFRLRLWRLRRRPFRRCRWLRRRRRISLFSLKWSRWSLYIICSSSPTGPNTLVVVVQEAIDLTTIVGLLPRTSRLILLRHPEICRAKITSLQNLPQRLPSPQPLSNANTTRKNPQLDQQTKIPAFSNCSGATASPDRLKPKQHHQKPFHRPSKVRSLHKLIQQTTSLLLCWETWYQPSSLYTQAWGRITNNLGPSCLPTIRRVSSQIIWW